MGNDIEGVNDEDNFGSDIALNDSGDIIVIGAQRFDGNATNSGYAQVYQFNGNNWIQIEQNLLGEGYSDFFGGEVAINNIGDLIAIGAVFNGANDAGYVKVFNESSLTLNINNFSINDFSLYPNPTSKNLTITSRAPIKTIFIYDFNGKAVKSFLYSNKKEIYNINMDDLTSGIYLLKIQTKNSNLIQKIIKK